MPTTWAGRILFLATLLITASAFRVLRVEVGGLLMHPFLPIIMMGFVFLALPRLPQLPRMVQLLLSAFTVIYVIATLPSNGAFGESAKIITAVISIVTAALLVRHPKDYASAIGALAFATAFVGLRAVIAGAADGFSEGVNPFHGVGNKNAYSLYALPALLLAGFAALYYPLSRKLRWFLWICAGAIVLTIFSSGNRSGWLGVMIIAAMLLWQGRSIRTAAFLGMISIGLYGVMSQVGSTQIIAARYERTQEDTGSDEARQGLFREAIQISIENPLLGVSPQKLPNRLAKALKLPKVAIDPHNAIGHLAGGCGWPCLLLWLGFLGYLWMRPKSLQYNPHPDQVLAHNLLRMMVALWLIRGMFSREILYNPGFCVGLGMCLGWCMYVGVYTNRSQMRQIGQAA